MGIITLSPVLVDGVNGIDFSTIPLYGDLVGVNTIEGNQVLIAGDATAEGYTNAVDRILTWNDRNQTGYLMTDFDLTAPQMLMIEIRHGIIGIVLPIYYGLRLASGSD